MNAESTAARDGPVSAVVDVGSNTIRLLVARLAGDEIEPILDESRFVRLGSGVDSNGRLDPDRKRAGIAALRELAQRAEDAGAESVGAVATSALRDAADGTEYVREIHEQTGVDVRIIDGEEEARLTYLGATAGLDLSRGGLLCDMGGGSSELILAGSSGIRWARSLQIGSGRLSERFTHHDPPTPDERSSVARYVDEELRNRLGDVDPEVALFTGGTASHVLYLSGLEGVAADIDLALIQRVEDLVYSGQSGEIAAQYKVQPERAAVLPAGITGIRAIAVWSGAKRLAITRRGIREGMIRDAMREQRSGVD